MASDMHITVKTLSGNLFNINVELNNTIGRVKELIQEEKGLAPEMQRLVFSGKLLDDDSKTLSECEVNFGSTLHLVKKVSPKQIITVKMLSGRTIGLEVEKTETIQKVMEKLEKKENFTVEQQRLIFAGKQLQKDTTVAEANIQTGATIHLVLRYAQGSSAQPAGQLSGSSVAGGGYPLGICDDTRVVGTPLQRGAVGLQNLGNTCFMNSSIQCLSNIPPLREFFLSEEYKLDINPGAYQTRGKLAEAFAELLKMMWREDTMQVSPCRFKWQVGQFAEQFSGYGQQDSMELVEYVLDGLKEDCNQVKTKAPYVEQKEADGRADDDVAEETLAAYRKRSSSRIDDLFVGLLKSTVCCCEAETCGRVSVTFDPFLSVKLPLANQREQRQAQLFVTLVRDHNASQEGESPVRQLRLSVGRDQTVRAIVEAAATEVPYLQVDSCVLVEAYNRRVYKFFADTETVGNIQTEGELLIYEVADVSAFRNNQLGAVRTTAAASSSASSSSSAGALGESQLGSSYGIVVHHRLPPARVGGPAASRALPLLLTVPRHGASGRSLCGELRRRLWGLGHGSAAGEPAFFSAAEAGSSYAGLEAPAPSAVSGQGWRLLRVDKWSFQGGSPIDPDGEELIDLQQSFDHYALEWEEGTQLPSWLTPGQDQQPQALASDGMFSTSSQTDQQDVRQLLQLFVEGEQLGEDNAWYCDRCKERRKAWKKLEFHRTPPALVLQLKRFQYTQYSRERLNSPVGFPLEGLDLSPYCTATARSSCDVNTMLYDLVGVCTHMGGLGGGHYIAHARSSVDGEWYCFDDRDVRRVSAEEVECDRVGAYVLFYVRRDRRPDGFGPPGRGDQSSQQSSNSAQVPH